MTTGQSRETTGRRAVQPSAPELARTVAARGVASLHALGLGDLPLLAATTTEAGQVLVVVPRRGGAADAVRTSPVGDVPACLSVVDHGPRTPHTSVRARLALTGWLTPVPDIDHGPLLLAFADTRPDDVLLDVGLNATLLRLDVAEVRVEGCGRRTDVSPEEFTAARPDPVAMAEDDMVAAAAAPLERLRRRVQHWAGPGDTVRLLGLDRYGVTFRVIAGCASYDLRVPFLEVVGALAEVPGAVRKLAACPHSPA